MNAILEISDLSAGYRSGKGRRVVLSGVNLSLSEGELVSLLGANGTGKSTLLRTVAGLQPPLSGELKLKGKPLHSYGNKSLSKLIGIVSTERTYAGGLTVRELVGLGRQPHTGFLGRLDADDRQIVAKSMDAVGISHKADCFLAELSDGERQKTMIAKALAQESPVIVLDEPMAFLDAVNRVEILQLLHTLAHRERKAILLSSHDISLSLALSDRVWLLSAFGSVCSMVPEDAVFQGRMSELFGSGRVRFDVASGEYVPLQDDGKAISVVGGAELNKWCCNALRRNGFRITDGCHCRVVVVSPDNIELDMPGEHLAFKSVEELIVYLLDAKNRVELWK